MALPHTNVPANNQETEPFFINSSPIKLAGLPVARVIKRKGDHYMLPRFPMSPTRSTHSKHEPIPISGSWAARNKRDYEKVDVSELEVGRFQPLDPLHGRLSLPVNIINLHRAPVFNPSDSHTSTFFQLMSLDMLPARGLPENLFWQLFSKCAICSNYMTTRTVPYHVCSTPGTQGGDPASLSQCDVSGQYFLRYLDVHGIGGKGGIPEDAFKSIFYACVQCGQYMTARLMWNHHEDADFDDYRCINLAHASSLPKPTFPRRRPPVKTPIQDPFGPMPPQLAH